MKQQHMNLDCLSQLAKSDKFKQVTIIREEVNLLSQKVALLSVQEHQKKVSYHKIDLTHVLNL